MKHVAFLTYPFLITALAALVVGGCSSKGTNTSQSTQASGRFGQSGTPAAGPKVTATITVRKSPDDVAVDSAGKLLYVTDSGDDTV